MPRPSGIQADGEKIRRLRSLKGVTRAELSRISGVRLDTLEGIEQGRKTTFKQLDWIAGGLRRIGYPEIKAEDLARSNAADGSGEVDHKPRPRRAAYEFVELWIDESIYASPDEARYQIGLIAYEYLKEGKVVQIRLSSIVITYRLPKVAAVRLVKDVWEGRYREFGVFDARIVDQPFEPSEATYLSGPLPNLDELGRAYENILDLAARYRSANPNQFNREWIGFLQQLRPLVVKRALAHGLRWSELDDVFSDLYTKLYTKLLADQPEPTRLYPLGAYLARITENHIINCRRKYHPRLIVESNSVQAEAAMSAARMCDQSYLDPEEAGKLLTLVNEFASQLKHPRDRDIWESFISGFYQSPSPTMWEIAKRFQVNIAIVNRSLFRLRRLFREFLDRRGYSPPWYW